VAAQAGSLAREVELLGSGGKWRGVCGTMCGVDDEGHVLDEDVQGSAAANWTVSGQTMGRRRGC